MRYELCAQEVDWSRARGLSSQLIAHSSQLTASDQLLIGCER
jgi:hypothetical protein